MRENTGVALGIAAVATFGYTIWAGVLVTIMWLCLTVYAVVKWIGAPTDHASPLTVLLILVANVTLYVILLTLGIYAMGRSMRYKKKDRDREASVPALQD
jgi:Kef-type K+ transport system membrane component KefB